MIVSSAQVYDEITIQQMIESKRGYDVITGIPFSIGRWPLLLERRVDIKQKIDSFLKKYPSLKTQVMNKDDEENIEWDALFEEYELERDSGAEIQMAHFARDQSELKHTAKQIFKPLHDIEEEEEKKDDPERQQLMMNAKQLYNNLDIKDRGWMFKTYKQWYDIHLYSFMIIYCHLY